MLPSFFFFSFCDLLVKKALIHITSFRTPSRTSWRARRWRSRSSSARTGAATPSFRTTTPWLGGPRATTKALLPRSVRSRRRLCFRDQTMEHKRLSKDLEEFSYIKMFNFIELKTCKYGLYAFITHICNKFKAQVI